MHQIPSEEALLISSLNALCVKVEHSTAQILRELEEKYNPNQPRVPRGNPDGGQWTSTGGGAGRRGPSTEKIPLPQRKPPHIGTPARSPRPALNAEEIAAINRRAPRDTPPEDLEVDPMFGVPRWMVNGRAAPAMSPLDVLGAASAARAVVSVGRASVAEAASVVKILRARIQGRAVIDEGSEKLRRAADAVEEFLGGRPEPKDVIINKSGDIVIMKGDKKFRMDVKNPGNKQDRITPDDPHFHLQRLNEHNKWVDVTNQHRNYFRRD